MDVDTFDDAVNAGDGVTSLREAVIQANTNPGDYEIRLQAGTYWLTRSGHEDAAARGDLDILDNGSVRIVGAGSSQTIIHAGGDGDTIPALADRVFQVHSAGSLTLEGAAVKGGNIASGLAYGGAFSVGGIAGGALNLIGVEISANVAALGGGGVYNNGAVVTITGSTISGNMAGRGGGIFNENSGAVTISGSMIADNTTAFDGGGVYNTDGGSTLTIRDSAISDNSAGNTGSLGSKDGGGIFNGFGGELTVSGSTLSNNSAERGGGIFNWASGSRIALTNSTLSGNSAEREGGAVGNYFSGEVEITNSTIFGNRANADGANPRDGGGIVLSSATATLHNSIVAGNLSGGGFGPASSEVEGSLAEGSSFNLIGNAATSGGLMDGSNGNIVGVEPTTILDITLADNGGPTLTHALLPGSPAVNAGDPAFDAEAFDPPLVHDQRGQGFDRVRGGRIDVGAVERQEDPPAGSQVTGQVWRDSDANGLVDEDEPGIANVTVRLRGGFGGELLDEAVTDDQGVYVLRAPVASEVYVEFLALERHVYTWQSEPGSENRGSHARRGAGVSRTEAFTVGGGFGDASSPVRAGFVPLSESAPWQNPVEAADVNNDGVLSVQDVLAVVLQLREQPLPDLEGAPDSMSAFVDVDGNNRRTISDLLAVVTALRNSFSGGFDGSGEGEAAQGVDSIAAESAACWLGPNHRDRALLELFG